MGNDEVNGTSLAAGILVATVLGVAYWLMVLAAAGGVFSGPWWFTAIVATVIAPTVIAGMMTAGFGLVALRARSNDVDPGR